MAVPPRRAGLGSAAAAAMLTAVRQRAAAAAAAAASFTSVLLLSNSPAQAETGAGPNIPGPIGSARVTFAEQPRGACPPLKVERAIVLTRHGDVITQLIPATTEPPGAFLRDCSRSQRTPAAWADSRSASVPAVGNQIVSEAEAKVSPLRGPHCLIYRESSERVSCVFKFWDLNNASLVPSAEAVADWKKYCPANEANFPAVTASTQAITITTRFTGTSLRDCLCFQGTLTWLGAATQHANGIWLRERYVHQHQLLPETLTEGSVRARSTPFPRCVHSLKSDHLHLLTNEGFLL